MDSLNGLFGYRLAFLPRGDYTVALTCEARDDDPEEDVAIAFERTDNVRIDAGEVTTHHFQ